MPLPLPIPLPIPLLLLLSFAEIILSPVNKSKKWSVTGDALDFFSSSCFKYLLSCPAKLLSARVRGGISEDMPVG